MDADIRWKQRLGNFTAASSRLGEAMDLAGKRALSDLEKQGLIQAFEFTHELAWNLMKDWFEYQGATDITGSRDATRRAVATGLVSDGAVWMEMIRSRNESSHTYNLDIAERIVSAVVGSYWPALEAFRETMKAREKAE